MNREAENRHNHIEILAPAAEADQLMAHFARLGALRHLPPERMRFMPAGCVLAQGHMQAIWMKSSICVPLMRYIYSRGRFI